MSEKPVVKTVTEKELAKESLSSGLITAKQVDEKPKEDPGLEGKQELYCDGKKIGMTSTCEQIGFENGLPIYRITGELFKGFENALDGKHLITLENDKLTVKTL